MADSWKSRCDDNHLGHFFFNYMREKPSGIIHQIDAATGEHETSGSVLSRSIRLSQCFGKLGLVPGDAIVIGGRNHLDVHIPFYAGLMSGLPVAGIDPALKSCELAHLLKIVEPKIIFCEYDVLEEHNKTRKELNLDTEIITFGGGENSLAKFMDGFRDLPPEEEFQVATFNTDKVYCLLSNTSGSTGRPKVVALTHSHMLQMLDFAKYDDNYNGIQKTVLNLSTLHWLSGSFNALLMPINHIKVQTSAPATGEHVTDIINKYKPVGILCSPTAIAQMLQDKTCDMTCFDVIKIGGSKVHTELLAAMRSSVLNTSFNALAKSFEDIPLSHATLQGDRERIREDTIIMHIYGHTESGGIVLQTTSDKPNGNIGPIDPKFKAKLITPDGVEILEPNVTGELLVKGPTMAGYYRDPKATKEAYTEDGYLKSGDLFYRDENDLYYFVERSKMMLKYRSYQVVPPEVEEVILKHEGVADVCVTGIPHFADGEHIVACVVRQKGSKVSAQEIKDLVAEHLSDFKRLRGGVVFLDALPITSSGKIGRMEIKKLVLTAHRE